MKASLSYYAERLWSHAARRDDVNHYARRKGTAVYWLLRQKHWIGLRWCHVIEKGPEVIRFSTLIAPNPPKTLWIAALEPYLRSFLEVTLWSGELDEKKFKRLAEIFSYPERALDWELLDWMESDTNLWSAAALAAERKARLKLKKHQ